jgi:hypothetical protein
LIASAARSALSLSFMAAGAPGARRMNLMMMFVRGSIKTSETPELREINFTTLRQAGTAGELVTRDKTHKLLFERKLFGCRIHFAQKFVTLKDEKSKERSEQTFFSGSRASRLA